MTIILAHNHYQLPGGEDVVFRAEAKLLEANGHSVVRFSDDNSRIPELGKTRLAIATLWNQKSYERLSRLLRTSAADLVHFHNTFPLLSPACYYAAKSSGAAVVQTLHNYRLVCPSAVFYRNGEVCEDCAGHLVPWPGVVHKCYRSDRVATSVTAAMLAVHRIFGTWQDRVDAYIALTEFARAKFVKNGLPADRIHTKPIFLEQDPGVGQGSGGYGLFIGRLVEEKGLRTLLDAWGLIPERYPLHIVGDGPQATYVEHRVSGSPHVQWSKRLSREDFWARLKEASFLVVPSLWYEGLPGVVAEAFAVGCPVIASNLGSLSSLIDHRRTGLHFEAGNPVELSERVKWLVSHPSDRQAIRANARQQFLAHFTAETNYERLMQVYHHALTRSKKGLVSTTPARERA